MKLQKTLDVQPQVASRPGAAPPSSFGSNVMQVAGNIAEERITFKAEEKKADFEADLQALGHEVAAKRAGKEFKGVTSALDRLKIGKDQDIYSDTYVQIATEKLLKEAIGKSPMFASELRQHAAETLNFDPTGAYTRSLFAKVPQAGSGPQSYADKQREKAQWVSDNTGASVESILKLQAQTEMATTRAELVAKQAAVGAYNQRDIVSSTLQEGDKYLLDVMTQITSQVKNGGLSSPEQDLAVVQSGIMAQKKALRDRFRLAGANPSPVELSQAMDQIDEQWAPTLSLIEGGSLRDVLGSQASSLASAMTIESMSLMGDVAMHNAAGGQAAVNYYFKVQDRLDDPGALRLLQESDPALKRVVQSMDDAKRFGARAYNRVTGVQPEFAKDIVPMNADEERATTLMADRIHRDMVASNDLSDEMRAGPLAHAAASGSKYKMLGNYFQKGVRQNASEGEIRFVTQTFQEEYPQLMDRIIADMNSAKGTRDEYVIVATNGKLSKKMVGDPIRSKPGKGNMSYWGGFQAPASEPVTSADLVRLQNFNDGVSNGWDTDLGVNAATFLSDTVSEINSMSEESLQGQEALAEATEAWKAEPTMENWNVIKSIDPDFAADFERQAGYGGGK